ncbi:hypothetical protein [Streptomyces fradiae]|uniref:hypothetical protein n=1 Tax=Streptomyces fradiae TaxID=1906 RepID=UPI0038262B63
MRGMTDEEIVRHVRTLAELERRRAALAARVERLREATAPGDLAERDRAGTEMAVLTDVILLESAIALDHLGLTTAALAVQHVRDGQGAARDGA